MNKEEVHWHSTGNSSGKRDESPHVPPKGLSKYNTGILIVKRGFHEI